MPKGVPNKRYTPEFKQKVVEAVVKEGLSDHESARLDKVNGHDRIQSWERIDGCEQRTINKSNCSVCKRRRQGVQNEGK